ncbi:MAG TPA: DUF5916 domain-containing protein, partial [Gemmatimonadales bacterium]|nr:DUF5916 domain-containing protein [Gemmatimonadales bacterium]
GRFDDPAWRDASWFTDFQQKDPVEFGAPAESTSVAFLYDDKALYVGARLYGRALGDIVHSVTRRDQFSNAEHFIVILDPYHDRRTGYSFIVSAAGVRSDYYHPTDSEGSRDYGFNPVWEASVSRDSTGWFAELRIPFSQLRFTPGEQQTWGMNINRWMPGRNEDVYWVVIPRSETGFMSRFGTLTGIRGIKPSRRVELLPYLATEARFRSDVPPDNPFDDGSVTTARAGADLKIGLGPNLTVDATVNPDFGQVEADPAEINLSAFETFFSERRPFFTEGASLLGGHGPGYFYSRRIGAAPRGPADGRFVDRPTNSTILGAAKLTGRLGSGLSIGSLAAITDNEFARVVDTAGTRRGIEVTPLTAYGVARVQQEFGRSQSTVGLMLTGVGRDLAKGDPLAPFYNTHSVTGGIDWALRWQGGGYEFGGFAGFSHNAGSRERMVALQRASQRYFQRPDQDYVSVNPNLESMTGVAAGAYFERNAGEHWLYNVNLTTESPDFELNDLGRLAGSDDIDVSAGVTYRVTRPARLFRNWSINVNGVQNLNYGWQRQYASLNLNANAQWLGFQQTYVGVHYSPRYQSDVLTRGGPLMAAPGTWSGNLEYNSGEASDLTWHANLSGSVDEFGGKGTNLGFELRFRPIPALQLTLFPSYSWDRDERQYLTTRGDGSQATFGGRYIFGAIDQTVIATELRLNYAMSPDLTLEGYVQPFVASGRYSRIGELPAPRSRTLRRYGRDNTTIARNADGDLDVVDNAQGTGFTLDNPDFRQLSVRGNLVLRWEWRPGSTLFLVWQQDRGAFSRSRARVNPGDLFGALGESGQNFLALKVSYWLGVS